MWIVGEWWAPGLGGGGGVGSRVRGKVEARRNFCDAIFGAGGLDPGAREGLVKCLIFQPGQHVKYNDP